MRPSTTKRWAMARTGWRQVGVCSGGSWRAVSRSIAAAAAATDAGAAGRRLAAGVDMVVVTRLQRIAAEGHFGPRQRALFPWLHLADVGAAGQRRAQRSHIQHGARCCA